MRFFLFSIWLMVLMASCKSEYTALEPRTVNQECIRRFGLQGFNTSWYSASVDVYGKHLSGLLLIKDMGTGSFRTVFTNEAGVSFFDFEFGPKGEFQVKRVIKQLDRKPVINILKEDFSLLLGIPFSEDRITAYQRGDEVFYAVPEKTQTAYFITDAECASLYRLELGSKRKRKVSIGITGDRRQPESVKIRHHTFDMIMNLKKIERE